MRLIDWSETPAAIWRRHLQALKPVTAVDPIGLDRLVGIDRQKQLLCDNIDRFLRGLPAKHVLLWGARGTGKSSLVKALLNAYVDRGLRVVEFPREELQWVPEAIDALRDQPYHFLLFCDDLSFETGDRGYKGLKTVMEGSIELPPENVLVCATSNRRHLVPEYLDENLSTTVGVKGEIHFNDSIEERISLADRFGLSLSFYQGNLDDYLRIVDSYFPDYTGDRAELHVAARKFAEEHASRSGRTAWQFFRHRSGR